MKKIICCLLALFLLFGNVAESLAAKKETSAAYACPSCGMEIGRTEFCPWCGAAPAENAETRKTGRARPQDITEWMKAADLAERYDAEIRDGVPVYTPADPLPLTAFIVLDDRSEGTDKNGIGPLKEKGVSSKLSGVLTKFAEELRRESNYTIQFTRDPDQADLLFTVLQTYPYRGEYKSQTGMGQRVQGYSCTIEITVTQLTHPAFTFSTRSSNAAPDTVSTSGGSVFWMDPPDLASGDGPARFSRVILHWYGFECTGTMDRKDRNDVVMAQTALAEMGYYSGKITGKPDDALKEAVKALQRDRGLEVSGFVDRGTMLALYFDDAAISRYTKEYRNERTEQLGRIDACCPGCGKRTYASDAYRYCSRCGTALLDSVTEGIRTVEGVPVTAEHPASVGDVLLFGRYEQDNDRSNGPEPVEWIVVAEEDGNLLLLSRYALTARPYEPKYSKVRGSGRNLTTLLKDDLPDAIFTAREQLFLRFTKTGNSGSSSTTLFALSAEEAEQYLASEAERTCQATKFAFEMGARKDASGNCQWWLRAPADDWKKPSVVDGNGTIRTEGVDGKNEAVCMRPAVWVDPSVTLPGAPEPAEAVPVAEAQPGDVVTFGSYEQDGVVSNGREPIEWIVLAREKNRLLLLARHAVDSRAYVWSENLTWEISEMRAWLNGTFLKRAFTLEEKGAILSSKLKTPKNRQYGTKGGKDTTDLVFLLSEEERAKYVPTPEMGICLPTVFALECGAYADEDSGSVRWWLRTPGEMQGSQAFLSWDGRTNLKGASAMNHGFGIRPAIWIKTD